MESILVIFSSLALSVGALVGGLYLGKRGSKNASLEEKLPETPSENSLAQAKTQAKEIVLSAKEEALKIKKSAEDEAERISSQHFNRVKQREADVAKKDKELEETLALNKRRAQELEEIRAKQVEKLEKVSGVTKEEAKKIVLDAVERKLSEEIGKRVREAEENTRRQADILAKEVLLDAMHSASTDYVAEYTISKVKLDDPEMKGRIIGKEGRNIRAFEEATGVNIDMDDDTPNEVRVSCYDSVRREVARVSLERLIADGRIQPARIDDVVKKTQTELERIMYKEGENLSAKFGVFNLPKEIISLLGRYKYRYSYGQNMIEHTMEETQMGIKIAKELGVNVYPIKVACLLHDIGKVLTDEEGSHIELAEKLLKKYKFPDNIIKAVAEHHTDKPSNIEGIIVQIADSISGARPGARYVDFGDYVKRMTDLESAAKSFAGVEKAFAISAGRELRVIVKPNEVSDEKAAELAHSIAEKIEKEQTYPGTVKVLIIRDLRVSEIAK
ncbi:ribonuclease Y [candidate division WWE3 bacterium CG09_land_8_20_14_0_10_39_24]|uniref:Ribonuclease Y n=2 Tax=Katanobacteria TaxID=422282 RepID=A0A2G9XD26_UNCKA|nr:MAG: ribonuclease Y [bacterium CG2_30_40_12]OJI08824.1 MAG: ribonuclease Y [bacterium CG09_39_24]PIP04866.1 MAG: ribonuclease Y [candidate division WWE3 bacterium CG23_combo_of_CG06-09_8_20_14_all_40_14]PIS12851.1 MAG: ribonuclease Y [candidate division WWE3 bacterium CG09_land_8_20_14_0_10_39_24]PJE50586.1 MAG: ribonuclease Y [candidate division WWE3 bacterium CG10_big_fil_rev_8_21_14_0_10_39_14]